MSEEGEDFGDGMTAADTANDIVDLISSLYDYHEVLTQLLQEKNLDGYTPFMSAVASKVSQWYLFLCPCLIELFIFPHLIPGLLHSSDVVGSGRSSLQGTGRPPPLHAVPL